MRMALINGVIAVFLAAALGRTLSSRAAVDRAYMQEEGLRNEADYLLGKGGYYRVERIADGQVRVICLNGGDATVRPTDQFGSLIVDCGTK
jgi:hypothetical protein